MTCSAFREAISARLDGEALGMPSRELDAHLVDRSLCAGWAGEAAA